MEKVETKRVPLGSREAFTDLFRRAAPSAGTALCGAALAGIVFQGEEAPFAAALCAGASGGLYIPASLGACVGAFVFGDSLDVLRQVAAVTLVFLLRSAAKYVLRVKVGAPAAGMMAFLSVLLAAETVAAAASPDAASVLLGFAKALAAFAAACFFYRVFLLAPDGGIFAPAAPGDRAAILFSGSVLLLSLVRFRFGAFVPVHIPGFVLVMAAALIGGETAGAVVGICTGLVLGTADGAGFLLAALPAAGLAGGIVSCYGKAAVGSVFALVYALALSVGGAPGTVARVAEAGAGILLFICLPKRVADGFSEKLSAMDPAERDPGRLFLRLGVLKAAKAVRRISALMTASQQLGHRQRPSAEALTAGLRQAVCADCKKQDFCFGDALELTQKAFAEATETLGRTGTLDAGSLPARLRTLCPSPASAAEGICSCMREMSVRQAAEQAARDCRAQSAAAISQLAGVMEAAAGRAREEDDPNLAALARNVLRGQGYAVSAVRFTHAGGGVLTVLCRRVPENAGIGRRALRRRRDAADVSGAAEPEGGSSRAHGACHRADALRRLCGDLYGAAGHVLRASQRRHGNRERRRAAVDPGADHAPPPSAGGDRPRVRDRNGKPDADAFGGGGDAGDAGSRAGGPGHRGDRAVQSRRGGDAGRKIKAGGGARTLLHAAGDPAAAEDRHGAPEAGARG